MPNLGYVNLANRNNLVYLPNDNAVRITELRVNTRSDALATIRFHNARVDQLLYIDNIWMSSDSFLEFDASSFYSFAQAYVLTRIDDSSIIDRIGFYHKALGRRGAKFEYWGDSWFRISMDETKEWNPPMVPEPSTYGAIFGALGGLLVAVRKRMGNRKRLVLPRKSESKFRICKDD